ncbi:recovery protein 3 isoform X2 [Wolffia australiana]
MASAEPSTPPSPSSSNVFSMRIVSLDYYMAAPIPGLDFGESPCFKGRKVEEVPVIRIYGSTLAGQKTCLHVHRALPYLYVPFSELQMSNEENCTREVSGAVEKALQGKYGSKRQHVHGCCLVRAKKFYGYHSHEELFVKIYIYHPTDVGRAAALLLSGSVLNISIQPYETHIPFLLQFMVLPKVALNNLRAGLVMENSSTSFASYQVGFSIWLSSTVPEAWTWTASDKVFPDDKNCTTRQSICELEGDTSIDDILNQCAKIYTSFSQTSPSAKMVQSLVPIWEEELERSGLQEYITSPDLCKPSPESVLGSMWDGCQYENTLSDIFSDAEKKSSCVSCPLDDKTTFELASKLFHDSSLMPAEGNMLSPSGTEHVQISQVSSSQSLAAIRERSIKGSDAEALGLLSWLTSSEAVSTDILDDELLSEAILNSQLLSDTYEKAYEKAHLENEVASQKECQDILDSLEDFQFDNQDEATTSAVGDTFLKVIPQIDGNSDDLNDFPRVGKTSKLGQKRKSASTSSFSEEPTGLGSANKKKRCRSWNHLPISSQQMRTDAVCYLNEQRHNTDGASSSHIEIFEAFKSETGQEIEFSEERRDPDDLARDPVRKNSCSQKTIPGYVNFVSMDVDVDLKTDQQEHDKPALLACNLVKNNNTSPYACHTTSTYRTTTCLNQHGFIEMTLNQRPPIILRSSDVFGGSELPRDIIQNTSSLSHIIDERNQVLGFPPFFGGSDVDEGVHMSYAGNLDGIPLNFRNDGSFSYLLTFALNPPSRKSVDQWLLVQKKSSGSDPLNVSELPSIKDDCPGNLSESCDGYYHDNETMEDEVLEDTVYPDSKGSFKFSSRSCEEDMMNHLGTGAYNVEYKLSAENFCDFSQITGQNEKAKLTPLSQIGFRDPASCTSRQNLTLLSLEIQAESRGTLLPDPKIDAINLICLAIQEDTGDKIKFYVISRGLDVATYDRNIVGICGCEFVSFPDEQLMLDHLVKTINFHDPDIFLGWEVQGSSLGFLAERARHLGMNLLKNISRTPDFDTKRKVNKSKENYNSSAANEITSETVIEVAIEDEWGRTHASGIHVGGRIVLNLWRLMRSEIRLNLYTVESVAEEVLRRKIPCIPCSTLNSWFSSAYPRARFRCITYVLERAHLNLLILNQLDMVNRTSELARVFGIDFFSVISRGSQFRVESMLLRLMHSQNCLALSPGYQQVAAQPAMECLPLVMEPESGFYADPVVVLDFQSLYPSMIIAYNLCYSTCLGKVFPSTGNVLGVSPFSLDPHVLLGLKSNTMLSPNGVMYVSKKVRKGVLPCLLDEILSTRVMVKKAMKKLTPSQKVLERILNARQLALKLIANVTYGYTAAGFSGRMPCAELADSIVQCGRKTLERSISFINSHSKWNARVVYGDTDSMFVLLQGRSREEAFDIGKEIALTISSMNPEPVLLKMEKVYHPCFLLTKKRYVGYSYEGPGQDKPTFDAKGIETVRRDTCPAVAKTFERSLRLFFEQQDTTQVKKYLQRQWGRILSGRVSLQDFIFAKEVRLGTYSSAPTVALPPAAIVAIKAMKADPRREPRYGERVPYVVVNGEPGARLVDMVVDPLELLEVDSPYRLNDQYYINKQIIPVLQRAFGLIDGVDLSRWFSETRRPLRPTVAKRLPLAGPLRNNRIDRYYLSRDCAVCGSLVNGPALLCHGCSNRSPSPAVAILTGRTSRLERNLCHLSEICQHCGGGDWIAEGGIKCDSLACAVFFERRKVQKELLSLSTAAAEAGLYPRCAPEWF